jgi:hypothetical protein
MYASIVRELPDGQAWAYSDQLDDGGVPFDADAWV